MDATNKQRAVAEEHTAAEDEQYFDEWLRKRLSLYQSLEQQVQQRLSQTVQLASDFGHQMADEVERQRSVIVELRRRHEAEIAQARRQAEAEIAQARRQAEAEMTQQQITARSEYDRVIRETHAERERILSEAHAERERLLTESRRLSTRLAGLQRSLSDILQPAAASLAMAEPSLDPEPLPVPELSRLDTNAPPNITSEPLVVQADAPLYETVEQRVITIPEQHYEVGEMVTWIEQAPPETNRSLYECLVQIDDVKSIVIASDLMDNLAQLPEIETIQLLEYEQQQLHVVIVSKDVRPLAPLLKEQQFVPMNLLEEREGFVHLVYQYDR